MQGSRLPHRPEDEAVVDCGVGRRRQRLFLLRLVAGPLQDHFRGGDQGARRSKDAVTLTNILSKSLEISLPIYA